VEASTPSSPKPLPERKPLPPPKRTPTAEDQPQATAAPITIQPTVTIEPATTPPVTTPPVTTPPVATQPTPQPAVFAHTASSDSDAKDDGKGQLLKKKSTSRRTLKESKVITGIQNSASELAPGGGIQLFQIVFMHGSTEIMKMLPYQVKPPDFFTHVPI
jgi:hypothetical protein